MTPLVDTALARRAWSADAESDGGTGAETRHAALLRYLGRPDVPREVRLLAARGLLVDDAPTQLRLIIDSLRDPDPEVSGAAAGMLACLPPDLPAAVLAGRGDLAEFAESWLRTRAEVAPVVDAVMRPHVAGGGPSSGSPLASIGSQVQDGVAGGDDETGDAGEGAEDGRRPLSSLSVPERIKRAMAGSREERAVLVRDPNDMVARAVLSSPKLTEQEVETFARMTNVSDEVLRLISRNRTWTRNYAVTACLVRNPKTPPPISLALLPRLNQHDVKRLSNDRNVPEPVRLAARKLILQREGRKGS